MLMGTGWRIHTARRTSWRERSAQWFCSFCTPEELQQYLGKYWLHHQKPTWQRKNNHVKMYLLLNMAILHCHVSFLEDNFWLYQCQCPNKGNVKINKGPLLHRGTVATSTVRNAKQSTRTVWSYFIQIPESIHPISSLSKYTHQETKISHLRKKQNHLQKYLWEGIADTVSSLEGIPNYGIWTKKSVSPWCHV